MLIEWASLNLNNSITLHGLGYEIVYSQDHPYVTTVMLIHTNHLPVDTESIKWTHMMDGVVRVHSEANEHVLTARSFSNAIRTAW